MLATMLLTACGSNSFEVKSHNYSYATQDNNVEKKKNNVPNSNDTATQEYPAAYLELHFGNSEIYSSEITEVAYVADSYSGYTYYAAKSKWWPDNISEVVADRSYKVHHMIVRLPDNSEYGFSNVMSSSFDQDTNTIALYLWRDEPYILEKEKFVKLK